MSELLFKAVLDACVLFRAPLRDTLLRAAEKRLYQVYWSDIILEEVSRNLVETGKTNDRQASATFECNISRVPRCDSERF